MPIIKSLSQVLKSFSKSYFERNVLIEWKCFPISKKQVLFS